MASIKPLSTLPPLAAEPAPTLTWRWGRPGLMALMMLTFGGLLTLSSFEDGLTADALMPSLCSLYAWTPFFWRQDRYGMLLPFVLRPIEHPFYNLMVLSWLQVTLSLSSFVLTARFLLGRSSLWLPVGLSAIALHLALGPAHFVYETLGLAQFYAPALTLSLMGLWALETLRPPYRLTIATLLMALAGWFNFAVPIMVTLWLLVRGLVELLTGVPRQLVHHITPWWQARLVVPLLLSGFGVVVGCVLHNQSQYHQIHLTHRQDVVASYESLCALMRDMARELSLDRQGPYLAYAVVAMLIGGLAINLSASSKQAAWLRALKPMMVAVVAALLYAVIVAQQSWVRQELHNFRFLTPSALAVLVGSMAFWQQPLWARVGRTTAWVISPLVCVAITLIIVMRFGAPSLKDVRTRFDAWAGPISHEVLAHQATHLAGTYWQVWPRMMHANLMLYEAGETRRVWAMANREEATRHLWPKEQASWRIVFAKDDPASNPIPNLVAEHQLKLLAETDQLYVVSPRR